MNVSDDVCLGCSGGACMYSHPHTCTYTHIDAHTHTNTHTNAQTHKHTCDVADHLLHLSSLLELLLPWVHHVYHRMGCPYRCQPWRGWDQISPATGQCVKTQWAHGSSWWRGTNRPVMSTAVIRDRSLSEPLLLAPDIYIYGNTLQ